MKNISVMVTGSFFFKHVQLFLLFFLANYPSPKILNN